MNNIRLNTRAIIEKFFDGIFLNILLKVKGIISLPIIVNFFQKLILVCSLYGIRQVLY